ncbi:BLOC-1-related complex subunit 5 [Nematostella vectensis]|uniref:BLOC-1-related complex subunit 5 n=1 Tax=Nematostella vectensis TaxID=45351 RepID=UPI00207780B1|nr:BLOC-1-related complex subunit 5 [Nematostella vectensis]
MGQEQSSTHPGATHSPQKVPYTKSSVERPSPKPKREKAKLEDIVVVSQKSQELTSQTLDPDLETLKYIPLVRPILNASVQVTPARELERLEKFDLRPALKLCSRYEDHLRQCSEAVAFDQDMLASRIKEVDVNSTAVLSAVNDRHRKLVHVIAHLKKVEEMSFTLRRIDASMKKIVPLIDRLNNILPEEERLDPFSFEPGGLSINN